MADDNGRSLLEKILGIITEVRKGEAPTALLLTINVFFILTAYYIIKPVREALILSVPDGAELKAYAGGATAILFLFAVPAYAAFANRLPRNRLIIGVTFFFVGCLVLFYFLGMAEDFREYLGIPFYLWVGIFNMMFVAQFWAFANDVYTEEQGKRLFAMVGIGASVGAALGSKVASWLTKPPEFTGIESGLDVYTLLLVSAGLLVITAFLTQSVHVREGGGQDKTDPEAEKKKAKKRDGAFEMVMQHKYLMLLAGFHLLFTFVNTNGEYILGAIVSQAAPAKGEILDGLARKEWINQFYAEFFFYVNVLGVLLQSFAVSRLVKYGGIKLAFFVLPVIALGGAAFIAVVPALMVVRISKTLENATDYSINNTVRNMLWLPTTTEMKYKAKQAVDTFFVRMGDVSSAVLVYVGASLLSMGVRGFAIVNLVLILGWLFLAARIMQERKALEGRSTQAQPA